jgi:hypothetical protein
MAVDVASGRFEAGVLAGGGVRSGDPASGPDPLEHPATVRSKLSKPALKRTRGWIACTATNTDRR